MHRRYAPPSSPPLATCHAFHILPWCHVSCTAAGVRVLEGSEAVALEVAPDGASVRAVRLADGSTLRASALLLCSGAWLRVRTPSLSDSDSAVSTRVCSLVDRVRTRAPIVEARACPRHHLRCMPRSSSATLHVPHCFRICCPCQSRRSRAKCSRCAHLTRASPLSRRRCCGESSSARVVTSSRGVMDVSSSALPLSLRPASRLARPRAACSSSSELRAPPSHP